jgi:hypothetical protein
LILPDGHLHWLLWQVIPPVHVVVQLPQYEALLVVSTHVDPQSVDVGGAQPVTHAYRLPEPEHCGAVGGQTVVQLPQLAGLLTSVSQPSFAFAEQCIQPAAHDDSGTEHVPALQVAGPFTFFSAVQSSPQFPQFFASVCVFVH